MYCLCTPAFPLGNDSVDRVIDLRDSICYGYVESDTLRTVDIIVIHSNYCVTDTFSFEGCLKQFEQYNVCSHYMIDRDANIYYLVGENDIAWHAGKSNLPGTDRKMLNKSSIGIEIISTPSNGPTKEQYNALVVLTRDIISRHPIRYLMRHKDIAPKRKTDPWGFDWNWFCKHFEDKRLIYVKDK